jgi:hypothetical protein
LAWCPYIDSHQVVSVQKAIDLEVGVRVYY